MAAPDTRDAHDARDTHYGRFLIDGMAVALPMAALREVQPNTGLLRLPCQAPAVSGGLELRGRVVPVLDLALLLGRCAVAPERAQVVVLVHEGSLLGLGVDAVSGIFQADTAPEAGTVEPAGCYLGGLRQRDNGEMVSLLSVAALGRSPGLPRVPEAAAGARPAQAAAQRRGEPPRPVLLLACGRHRLAIDAMTVEATLNQPLLQPSVLAQVSASACRGQVVHAGQQIAALDLAAFCGLGALAPDAPFHAFVVRVGQGRVALLVSQVQDVVQTHAEQRIRLPTWGLRRAALFSAALPAALQPGAEVAGPPYLLLDRAALLADPELQNLAATNTPVAAADPAAATAGVVRSPWTAAGTATGSATATRTMVTYELLGEVATPIEQIAEILRHDPAMVMFDDGQPLLGILLHRTRSIPVFCLSALAGLPRAGLDHGACVLLVQHGADWAGFMVPRLQAIEQVRWAPELAERGALVRRSPLAALGSREMVLVDAGTRPRMLRVLDLQALLQRLQRPDLAAA